MSTRSKARRAGLLYVAFSLIAIVSEFFLPRFFVAGNAAATAQNILSAELMFRVSILVGFATLVMHLFVVASLYDLLKDVDAYQAMLMAALVIAGVAVALANQSNRFAALQFASERDWLAFGFMRMQRNASAVPIGFWGLWLFPFGILVIKSRFIPKIFGILLLVAGIGYTATSIAAILFPAYRPLVARIVTPLYVGELPVIFWLAIKGAREPQPALQPA